MFRAQFRQNFQSLASSSDGVTSVNFSSAFKSLTNLAKCLFLALSRLLFRHMQHSTKESTDIIKKLPNIIQSA